VYIFKVRSENRYGFLRPGLKTGVGLDFEMWAAHPHQKFQGVPHLPPPPLRAESPILSQG